MYSRLLSGCLLWYLLLQAAAVAQGWHGIVPLQSTRADVERQFGKPQRIGAGVVPDYAVHDYEVGDVVVDVYYSTGTCSERRGGCALPHREEFGWDVPRDTVIRVDLHPKNMPAARLVLPRRFKKIKGEKEGLPGFLIYRNRDTGVTYHVADGKVVSITYGPSAMETRLACPLVRVEIPLAAVCSGIRVTSERMVAGSKVELEASLPVSAKGLLFCWNASSGAIEPNGRTATWNTVGLEPGSYHITVVVSDQYGHAVECSTDVTLTASQPPVSQAR